MRRVGIGLLILAAIYGGVCWLFSDKLIAARYPSDEQVPFADLGLPNPESLTLTNGSLKLAGWYFANPKAGGCATVLQHGFAINKAVALGWAPLFWGRGCDILVFDLRSHGQSSPGLLTYGVLDKTDELMAVDWLIARTGLPISKIGLWGVSYGAATSIQAAAVRPDLAFVVADASYSSLSDIAAYQSEQLFGAWARIFLPGTLFISGLRAGFDPAEASPEKAIRGLKTPVLLIHSTTDEFTPSTQSEAIYAASDHGHTVLDLTTWGASHGESYFVDPVAYTRTVDTFLDTYAPGFGVRAATP
jgi:fermentation-respiration switch protein FrsA (DUF1100 family)